MALLPLFAILFLGLLFYNYYYKRRLLPPGPTPHPLIGNVFALGPQVDPHEVFRKWRKQYGDVFTIWFGEIPVVTVNEHSILADAYIRDGDAHVDRLKSMRDFQELVRGGVYGVVDAWGEPWKEQRKFALHVLRDFGLGKELMEQKVLDEVLGAISDINEEIVATNDVNVMGYTEMAVSSIINSIIFGYSFRSQRRFSKAASDPLVLTAMQHPRFLRHVPFFKGSFDKLLSVTKVLHDHFGKQIDQHRRRIDFDQPPLDYVDAFLHEQRQKEKEGGHHSFNAVQLENMCMDLWLGGQETTTTTLAWAITYLILHPDVQARLHAELEQVIGSDRPIRLSDRPLLPYANAVVNEVQRLANIFPINLFRETSRDTVIGSYRIPKGMCTMPQFAEVLYDEQVFAEPKSFKPERFLDGDGKLKKIDEFIPFSIGKRQCPGEGLARTEIFLFITNLFNVFKFADGSQPPSLKRTYGIFASCSPFTCRLEHRWESNGVA